MNQTRILRVMAVAAFGVTMAMSVRASANVPYFSYYPIAAPGCATSLSAWANGDTWVTGCGSSGDNTIFELVRSGVQPEQFQQRGFSAKQVAVDPASNPAITPTVWALTTAGALYQYVGSQSWVRYFSQPACTRAMGVGWNKEVWIIECNNNIDYLGSSSTFISRGAAPETMTHVAVPLNGGNPWFIAQSGNIYMYNNTWNKQVGCATAIAIGGDGAPWVVGCSSNANGNIYRWNGSGFVQVLWNQQINVKSIAVSLENIPWALGDGTTYPTGTIIERTAELDYKDAYVPQLESNWCWAAAGQSIYDYLDDAAHASRQQCDLVGGVLGRTDCCNSNQPCNQPGNDYKMLDYLGVHYDRQPTLVESWEGLASNLTANSPISIFYNYRTSTVGHSEVAEGAYVYQGTQYVERWNPAPIGAGTVETVTYPLFVSDPNQYASGAVQKVHF